MTTAETAAPATRPAQEHFNMAIIIGGISVPPPMNDSGNYKYNPPEILDYDGDGNPVLAPYANVVWTFASMTEAQFDWWATTICQDQRTRIITANSFLPKKRANPSRLGTFQQVRVHEPEVADFDRGTLVNVTVTIDMMIEDLV